MMASESVRENYETSLLSREIGSLDDVRRSLLETAFLYRKTAQRYIWLLTTMIGCVVSLFISIRYSPYVLSDKSGDISSIAANSSLHIAILILIIYLSQLLVGFSRYHYRVADKLFSQSSAVTLAMASGESERVMDFVKAMTLDIDFGKMPSTPIDKISESVAKIVSAAMRKTDKP